MKHDHRGKAPGVEGPLHPRCLQDQSDSSSWSWKEEWPQGCLSSLLPLKGELFLLFPGFGHP